MLVANKKLRLWLRVYHHSNKTRSPHCKNGGKFLTRLIKISSVIDRTGSYWRARYQLSLVLLCLWHGSGNHSEGNLLLPVCPSKVVVDCRFEWGLGLSCTATGQLPCHWQCAWEEAPHGRIKSCHNHVFINPIYRRAALRVVTVRAIVLHQYNHGSCFSEW